MTQGPGNGSIHSGNSSTGDIPAEGDPQHSSDGRLVTEKSDAGSGGNYLPKSIA